MLCMLLVMLCLLHDVCIMFAYACYVYGMPVYDMFRLLVC